MIYLASVVGYFNPRIKDLWKNDRARRIPIEIFEISTNENSTQTLHKNFYESLRREKKVHQHYFARTILKERVELKNYYEIITGKEGKKITILSRFDTSRLNYNLS